MNNHGEKQKSISHLLEFLKLHTEYIKHFTTLSTGSVVIMATFLEKLFTNPISQWLVVISFSGFIVSIVAAVITYTFVLDAYYQKKWEDDHVHSSVVTYSLIAMWLGFLVGIVSFAVFAILNLLFGQVT